MTAIKQLVKEVFEYIPAELQVFDPPVFINVCNDKLSENGTNMAEINCFNTLQDLENENIHNKDETVFLALLIDA